MQPYSREFVLPEAYQALTLAHIKVQTTTFLMFLTLMILRIALSIGEHRNALIQ
jgi:hypothetical protein